jgi:hypothetical protein
LDFRSAIETLLKYSLVEPHSKPDSYSMHSVVHEWCLELFRKDNEEVIQAVLVALGYAAPEGDGSEDWQL